MKGFQLVMCSAIVLVAACNDDPKPLTASLNASVVLSVGQELNISASTLGPSTFDSLPAISAPVIEFVERTIIGPYYPGGPHYQYRFRATARGTAIVSLTFYGASETNKVYVDTVTVR